ncbi:NAD-dependent malic enzyme [Georgenia sp. Z1344]|uniref:NAD-dependent malic enzyme n=1 Tax=Georgenia sp. Z1344 TaxID=3416706 RepID=UPI003CEC129E
MAVPSPSYTTTLRVLVGTSPQATAEVVSAVASAGGTVMGVDVVHSSADGITVDITADTIDGEHLERVRAAIESVDGASVSKVSDSTFLLHIGGKIEVTSKVPLRTRRDLSRAYTPGVARVCKAIAANKEDARRLTIKRNTVAVVTDGTAVLGLGDIGPEASLPVMEGKAALFKEFANVDAWPVALDTKDTEEIISIVKAIAPAYGGINLEDISAPRCFEIEARLRDELDIPVFHDDQHGTAVVVLAALINALRVVDKKLEDVKIAISGVGAAGHAIIQLLAAQGASHIVAYGREGSLHAGKQEASAQRQWIAENTNPDGFDGSLKDGLAGTDVFIGVSSAGILDGDDIATMADGAIVFALANPDPEVDPEEAARTAAVVATGRSDYPNQINNVLAFPGLFRGLLDAGASHIDGEMLRVAAVAIADVVGAQELNASFIIPGVFDPRVAEAVSSQVQAYATAQLEAGATGKPVSSVGSEGAREPWAEVI